MEGWEVVVVMLSVFVGSLVLGWWAGSKWTNRLWNKGVGWKGRKWLG